jgi:hypothetical protein
VLQLGTLQPAPVTHLSASSVGALTSLLTNTSLSPSSSSSSSSTDAGELASALSPDAAAAPPAPPADAADAPGWLLPFVLLPDVPLLLLLSGGRPLYSRLLVNTLLRYLHSNQTQAGRSCLPCTATAILLTVRQHFADMQCAAWVRRAA